ncbi:hypothetical protein GWO43_11615 [candidate division KSB1 bacterium]|nr:hypothetical protein [candidate division KSB1 bacterium]NIR70746.1 hypothetical protein [candidate division KSB1 bacterium]NIS24604.1 hypothetical protein [candidate division KSB1 bacterium]NIT71513.1 hypothetical protein [candidate division KSB1 bacterium]NIU25204.1 hypothetical protein [candidate division KSB1 bacterium]
MFKENKSYRVAVGLNVLCGCIAALLLLTGFKFKGKAESNQQIDNGTCMQCHQGIESMHADGDDEIGISCVDCHGGNANASSKEGAHVRPQNDDLFRTSANPKHSYTVLNNEDPDFIRFMNPGDFRIAGETCGKCHQQIYNRMLTSIMAHSSMVPQAGLYNNGVHEGKIPVFGEAYMRDGTPAIMTSNGATFTQKDGGSNDKRLTSLVEKLEPLPDFPMIPATDAFRLLERGNNDAGERGPGTDFHIAGAGIVLHKTRLNDPTLWFLGTNETGGDYRSSGCTACHVLYANDRNAANSGPQLEKFYNSGGMSGYSGTNDESIPKNEPGHPISHRLTVRVPVSQCLTCHHHQGNGALGNYVGAMWWDQESDADKILEAGARRDEQNSNEKIRSLYPNNDKNEHVQIEDWHGHSWNYRRVYYRDKKGNLLDEDGNIIPDDDPDKFEKAIHLKDIHFEKGLHCIDCHTEQDVHSDGQIWGAMIDGIEIRCEDCHGTATKKADLVTSGVASHDQDLASRQTGPRNAFGQRVFEFSRDRIIQRSKIYEGLRWEISQLVDSVDPSSDNYNEKAARAHTLQRDGKTYGQSVDDESQLAHGSDTMECYTCHSAWNTQCYGCHLSADVNRREDVHHYEGEVNRAYVMYNPQVLRADAFLMGINGSSKGNKYSPMRSASAVIVSARDRGRNEGVHQQPTISAPGYSGFAVTPNPPHTVRKAETKQCTDCHISEDNDNNAWLAAVYGMGTNAINFIGEYAYVALGDNGIKAIKVTEGVEPQPVIGSSYHKILHPESFQEFAKNGRRLKKAYGDDSNFAKSIQARGEFVFVADGPGGFKVYDRANISNKAKVQRLLQNQNSRFGQNTTIDTRDATCVALPSTTPMNLERRQLPINLEKPIAELFRYAYITDRHEGLIVVDVNTFHDNNPQNNYIERAVTYNPDNKLSGAVKIVIAGNYAYIMSEETGLNVVDISEPRAPKWLANIGSPDIIEGKSLAIQFRYCMVVDKEGFKVIDITNPPEPTLVPDSYLRLADGRDIYPIRHYAYVAAGNEGLAIIDIEKIEQPKLVQTYSAGGQINDANALTTGTVNASIFAFIADGKNGLRVVRLIGPEVPGHLGFSPEPIPELIATYRTDGPALAIAQGMKRDRPIDESGNQIGVSGRLGSYPLTKENLEKLYLKNGEVYTVKD